MSKIEQMKINVDISGDDIFSLLKVSDEVFEGDHPNEIYEGHIVKGRFDEPPTVGFRFLITNPTSGRYLSTSKVTKIIDEEYFKTENSIYKLVKIGNF